MKDILDYVDQQDDALEAQINQVSAPLNGTRKYFKVRLVAQVPQIGTLLVGGRFSTPLAFRDGF